MQTLYKKNVHIDDNSKTSVTPRKEGSSIHEKTQILWNATVSIYFIIFLPYLGSVIHNGSFRDHLTSFLKNLTFYCPLSSDLIYPIVYLIHLME